MSATPARRRTPGRWRRIPRAAPPLVGCTEASDLLGQTTESAGSTSPADALLLKELRELEEARKLVPTLTANGFKPAGPLLPEEVQMVREQWRRERLAWKTPDVVVGFRGSKELAESREQGNREMLEEAKRLEEEDEELCDTEEAKVAFRAFKVKFAVVYRRLATTKLA